MNPCLPTRKGKKENMKWWPFFLWIILSRSSWPWRTIIFHLHHESTDNLLCSHFLLNYPISWFSTLRKNDRRFIMHSRKNKQIFRTWKNIVGLNGIRTWNLPNLTSINLTEVRIPTGDFFVMSKLLLIFPTVQFYVSFCSNFVVQNIWMAFF